MTHHDLLRKLDDQPFAPFRIRLANNTTYDIFDPGRVIASDSSAVIATQNIRDDKGHRVTTDWRTVAIANMLEFSHIEPSKNGGKRHQK